MSIKTLLQNNDRKSIQSYYQERQNLYQQKQNIEKEFETLKQKIKEKQDLENKINILNNKIQDREQQLSQIQKHYQDISNKYTLHIKSNQEVELDNIDTIQQENKTIQTSINIINHLIQENTENRKRLNQIQEDEKIINNLNQILSKELLLLILQESIDQLNEIINVYL